MIPLYDDNPRQGLPLVTVALIAANVLVFLYEASLPPRLLAAFVELNGMVPLRLVDADWAQRQGFPGRGWHTVLSSMFLHANLLHILGNMWMLWLFGDNIEDRLGHFRFLLFYVACGLAAAATHVLTSLDSTAPVVGASGAVAGVMGAYFLLFPRARIITLVPIFFFLEILAVPAFLFLGVWILIQLWSGALTLGASQGGGVAFWAHVGGFFAGLLLIHPMSRGRRPRGRARYRSRRGPW